MASTTFTRPEGMPTELGLLESLVQLYDRELVLYGDILELSHKQTGYINENRPLPELRSILIRKNEILDTIARLESAHDPAKAVWERKKRVLVGEIPAKLQTRFLKIAEIIETILNVEAANDQLLMSAGAGV